MSAQEPATNLFSHGYALIIGTGTDSKGQLHHKFESTINDAEWLRDVLTDKSRCAYPPNQVTVLTSMNTTRHNILHEFDKLVTKTKKDPESMVLIFFSGHAIQEKRTDNDADDDENEFNTFIIPYGISASALTDNAISGQELYHRLLSLRSKKCVLLLNCCFASGVLPALVSTGIDDDEQSLGNTQIPLTKSQIEHLKEGNGLAVLSACRCGERSFTAKYSGGYGMSILKKYSTFTIGIGAALSGNNQDSKNGIVRISELAMSCRQFVSQKTKGQQNPCFDFAKLDNFAVSYYHGGRFEKSHTALGDVEEIVVETDAEVHEIVAGKDPNTNNQTNNVYGPTRISNGAVAFTNIGSGINNSTISIGGYRK